MKIASEILRLTEGTWAIPSTKEQANKLAKIMSKPLKAKDVKKIWNLVGDDSLMDEIDSMEKDDDIRFEVAMQLKDWVERSKKEPNAFKPPFENDAIKILKEIIKSNK
jgi:hypothetical protein